jgi:hypothetical protein
MLSKKDFQNGISTIEQKKENDCMYFKRMDDIFGSKQNVIPPYTAESQNSTMSDSEDDCSSEEEDEEKADDSEDCVPYKKVTKITVTVN